MHKGNEPQNKQTFKSNIMNAIFLLGTFAFLSIIILIFAIVFGEYKKEQNGTNKIKQQNDKYIRKVQALNNRR